jgi:hypothetical protein
VFFSRCDPYLSAKNSLLRISLRNAVAYGISNTHKSLIYSIENDSCWLPNPLHKGRLGHLGQAKWADLKHDKIGLARARSGPKDSGPCQPEAHIGSCLGLGFSLSCQARHDPFGRA